MTNNIQSIIEKGVLLAPLFNSSKYGIGIIGLDGSILARNNAFCDAFNLNQIACEGKTLHDIFPDQEHRIIGISFGLFIKQHLDGSGEWIITHPQNQQTSYIEYHFQLVQHEEERFVALYVNDITAKTEAERKLKEQYTLIKEYSSYNSHQIRSHVARILGLSMLFNFKDLSDSNNAMLIHYLHEEATRLDEVIHFLAQKTGSV